MADLKSLIRLRRHTVEEKQKVLAEIFRQIEMFEKKKKDLLENLERERQALNDFLTLETRAYYGRYEGVVRKNIDRINVELKKLETRINIAQEEVRTAFADMKRVEIVHERRKKDERKRLNDKETQEMDDIGIEGFRRQDEF